MGAGNDNPGNFTNRPTEEVRAIASKGGQASHGAGGADVNPGNFANRYGIIENSCQPSNNKHLH